MEGNEAKAEEILLPTKVFYHFWINEEDPKIAKMCPNPEWKHPLGNFFFTNFQSPCELKKFIIEYRAQYIQTIYVKTQCYQKMVIKRKRYSY